LSGLVLIVAKLAMWGNMLWQGGANFETPLPIFTKEGSFKPFPPTGARTLDSRTAFYYAYTLDSPGMIMRVPRVGSQYLMGFLDADKNNLDGGKTYKVKLGPTQPAGVKRGNWIQTMPGKRWFTLLRLYSPLEPFFTKEWRLSEIELVH
jgi:hypothetical protein